MGSSASTSAASRSASHSMLAHATLYRRPYAPLADGPAPTEYSASAPYDGDDDDNRCPALTYDYPEAYARLLACVGGVAPLADLAVAYACDDPRLDVLNASDADFERWRRSLWYAHRSVIVHARSESVHPVLWFPGCRWRFAAASVALPDLGGGWSRRSASLTVDGRRFPHVARRIAQIRADVRALGASAAAAKSTSRNLTTRMPETLPAPPIETVSEVCSRDNDLWCIGSVSQRADDSELRFEVQHRGRLTTRLTNKCFDVVKVRLRVATLVLDARDASLDDPHPDSGGEPSLVEGAECVLCHAGGIAFRSSIAASSAVAVVAEAAVLADAPHRPPPPPPLRVVRILGTPE
jgi:hypothetical protein